MTDRELMKMANRIEALAFEMKAPNAYTPQFVMLANEIRMRARLAQPEPEPVAWTYQHEDTGLTMCVLTQQVEPGFEKNNPRWQKSTPLYTAPPQREWQGLTDEEMFTALLDADPIAKRLPLGFEIFARAIEAKLKEKNSG